MSAEHVGPQTLVGFVTTGPGGVMRLAADDYGPYDGGPKDAPSASLVATWLDLDRRTLLVLDPGFPLGVSDRWVYGADASVRRRWMPVNLEDGAAVVDLSDDADRMVVRVARQPVRGVWDVQMVAGNLSEESRLARSGGGPMNTVPWVSQRPCLWATAPGAAATDPGTDCRVWLEYLAQSRNRRQDPGAISEGALDGIVLGRTPDGRRLVVGGMPLDTDGTRVIAGLVDGVQPEAAGTATDLVDAGPLDPDAVLPYAVRLPDRQGWVVARADATLRYRLRTSAAWTAAGADAALLPDADRIEVEVTVTGAPPQVVRLP